MTLKHSAIQSGRSSR